MKILPEAGPSSRSLRGWELMLLPLPRTTLRRLTSTLAQTPTSHFPPRLSRPRIQLGE